MTPPATSIHAAADALLRAVVKADCKRLALKRASFKGRTFMGTGQPGATDDLDPTAIVADPTGTACRAELRRIGHPLHADWRAMALETAGAGISGSASRPPRPYAAAAPTDLEPWGRCYTKQPA